MDAKIALEIRNAQRVDLENRINALGYGCQRAHDIDGVKTTVVVMIENGIGHGVVAAFVNGQLQESPMAIGMTAADAHQKAMAYGVSTATEKIRGKLQVRVGRD